MRLHTPLCDVLGIALPIIQAPIGSATTSRLAAAVSEAGGLGMLALTWCSYDEARQLIRDTRALTRRPFGVNLVLTTSHDERLRVCLDEGVRIVSFFWGDPSRYVQVAHDAQAIVIHTIGSVAEARRASEVGVDVLVAQGWEAGGHVWGDIATVALVPQVTDAVSPLPVVAAGGIADGRGIAAALMLGATGAWVGTRFLASDEAGVHVSYKERIVQAVDTETVHSSLFDIGWPDAPHRTLRNSTVRMWEAAGRPGAPKRPGEGDLVATSGDGSPIVRYSDAIPLPSTSGDLEAMALYAGQGAGLVSRVDSAGTIVRQLADDAVKALRRAAHLTIASSQGTD